MGWERHGDSVCAADPGRVAKHENRGEEKDVQSNGETGDDVGGERPLLLHEEIGDDHKEGKKPRNHAGNFQDLSLARQEDLSTEMTEKERERGPGLPH